MLLFHNIELIGDVVAVATYCYVIYSERWNALQWWVHLFFIAPRLSWRCYLSLELLMCPVEACVCSRLLGRAFKKWTHYHVAILSINASIGRHQTSWARSFFILQPESLLEELIKIVEDNNHNLTTRLRCFKHTQQSARDYKGRRRRC